MIDDKIYTPAAYVELQDQMRQAPTAGAWVGTESAARCAPIAGDPGAALKMIKVVHRDAPRGVEKADAPAADAKPEPTRKLSESERITGPASVTDLIRKAQGEPGAIEDLERGYSGREQAALAKAAAAKPRQVTASTLDHASPALKKVLGDFDQIVRRAVKRAMA